jgi:hypothetical protein
MAMQPSDWEKLSKSLGSLAGSLGEAADANKALKEAGTEKEKAGEELQQARRKFAQLQVKLAEEAAGKSKSFKEQACDVIFKATQGYINQNNLITGDIYVKMLETSLQFFTLEESLRLWDQLKERFPGDNARLDPHFHLFNDKERGEAESKRRAAEAARLVEAQQRSIEEIQKIDNKAKADAVRSKSNGTFLSPTFEKVSLVIALVVAVGLGIFMHHRDKSGKKPVRSK